MDFNALGQKYLDDINALMNGVVAASVVGGTSLEAMYHYHMSTGGKRLRALLPLAVAQALSVPPERLLPWGAACEMLHNATLVHDDVQDGDRLRRGQPTVWAKYGTPRAINLGDAMLYWAPLLLMSMDAAVEKREALIKRLLRQSLLIMDGQEREFLLKDVESPSMDAYFKMVEGKTGGLFMLTLAGAAEFCDAPAKAVADFETAAAHLGVLFQVQDDVLDLYADKGRLQRGADIFEGKISVLVVHFLANAPQAERAWLRGLLNAPREHIGPDDIAKVARAFRERGSLDFAVSEIARRHRLALKSGVFDDYPALSMLLNAVVDRFVAPIRPLIDARATGVKSAE